MKKIFGFFILIILISSCITVASPPVSDTQNNTSLELTKAKIELEQLKAEAEAKAKQEAEAKAKQEAEAKAKQEAEAKAKQEAEAKAKQEAEAKAKQEAEAKAKQEAEAKAKQEAEAKAKQEAEAKAKQEAEAKAKQEAEAKAKEAETKLLFELLEAQKEREKAETELEQLKNQTSWENITKDNEKKIIPIYLNSTSNPIGTGFIFKLNRNDNAAFAITNNHVVKSDSNIQVKILNKKYSAQVLIRNEKKDLAILRICCSATNNVFESVNLIPVTVELGTEIGILGYPLGSNDMNITTGVISAKKNISDLLIFQTDTLANPGNSGGPAINNNGNLIGVVSEKLPNTSSVSSVTYIISIDELLDFIYSIDASVYNSNTSSNSSTVYTKPDSNNIYDRTLSQTKKSPTTETITFNLTRAGKTYSTVKNTELTYTFSGYNLLNDGSRFQWSHNVAFRGILKNGEWSEYYIVSLDYDGYVSWGIWRKNNPLNVEEKFIPPGSFNINGNNTFKIITLDDKGFFFINGKLVFNMDLNKSFDRPEKTYTWAVSCPTNNYVACQKGLSEVNTYVSIYETLLYSQSYCNKESFDIIGRLPQRCTVSDRSSEETTIMIGSLNVGDLYLTNKSSSKPLYKKIIWLNRKTQGWDNNYPGDVIIIYPEGHFAHYSYSGAFSKINLQSNYVSPLQQIQKINVFIIDNVVNIFLDNETKLTNENFIKTISFIPNSNYSTYKEFHFNAELKVPNTFAEDNKSITKLTDLKYYLPAK